MPLDEQEGSQDSTSLRPRRPRGRLRTPILVASVVAVVAALALGGAALGVATQRSGAVDRPQPHCGPTAAKLTVQGTGQATGTPDLLTVVVQVAASGPSATAAMATDNTLAGG